MQIFKCKNQLTHFSRGTVPLTGQAEKQWGLTGQTYDAGHANISM
jgi:hypothetical protein